MRRSISDKKRDGEECPRRLFFYTPFLPEIKLTIRMIAATINRRCINPPATSIKNPISQIAKITTRIIHKIRAICSHQPFCLIVISTLKKYHLNLGAEFQADSGGEAQLFAGGGYSKLRIATLGRNEICLLQVWKTISKSSIL